MVLNQILGRKSEYDNEKISRIRLSKKRSSYERVSYNNDKRECKKLYSVEKCFTKEK